MGGAVIWVEREGREGRLAWGKRSTVRNGGDGEGVRGAVNGSKG